MLERLETSMTTEQASQQREQVLTLLLIERDQVNEKLLELGFGEIKRPALKRNKRSKGPLSFVSRGRIQQASS